MTLTFQGQAPYAPSSAIVTVLDKHRSNGLSTPVDATRLVQIGVSETLVPRTLKAMRLLDLLTDDGMLTEQMDLLGKVPPNEFNERLAEWVRSVYAPVFQAVGDPASAASADLENAFFGYEPKGQLGRMVTLFTGLCAYAGIIDKPPVKKTSTGTNKKRTPKASANKTTPFIEDQGRKEQDAQPPADIAKAKARYVDLLLSKLEAIDAPDADLFDRIERVLGVSEKDGVP